MSALRINPRHVVGFITLLMIPWPIPAQRAFQLTMQSAGPKGVILRWRARSATPVGDLMLVPRFQVERSADLKVWTPMGGIINPSLGQLLSVIDTTLTG